MQRVREMVEKKTLSFAKGERTYVFSYVPGGEDKVFEQAMRLAGDPGSDFSMMDAAKLSFRLAKEMADECYKEIAPPQPQEY